ncbi:MAG: nucleotidyltransferase domain-containing protein [Nanoarchaeota archaeon]
MILAYIYDFISFLFEKDLKREIKNIILYGSVASQEYDKESDIDLFIEIWDKNKKNDVEKKVKEQLNKFEDISVRVWYPRGINNSFSIIIDSLDSPNWKNLKQDIISNGILLYGKFKENPEKTQHKALFTFALNKISQQKKMMFIRELYGYEQKKPDKKTTYKKQGMLEKQGGIKLSQNAIMIPIEKTKEFREFFSKLKITPEIREVWMR